MDDLSTWQVLAITQAIKLTWLFAALYAAVRFSAWLDRRAGNRFQGIFQRITESRIGAALYLGMRWIGICLAVGLALS